MTSNRALHSRIPFAAMLRARIKDHGDGKVKRAALFMIMNCPSILAVAEQLANRQVTYEDLSQIVSEEYAYYAKRFAVRDNDISELIAMHSKAAETAGFTLVELSIVLVIIGLLIGGILVAQSMIGTAKIQSTVRQLQQYDTAVVNFETKYNQLPGDSNLFPNVGNNDGMITEWTTFWPHLSQGVSLRTSAGVDYLPFASYAEAYCPRFPIQKDPTAVGVCIVAISEDAGFGIKNYYRNAGGWYSFLPSDALVIDTKIDDGKPNTGKIIITPINGGACVSGTAPNQAYMTATKTNDCGLYFEVGASIGK